MNYSDVNAECMACKPDIDFSKCKPKSPKPKKIQLECGQGTGMTTFTSTEDDSFQLAHVTVNTSSLKKPEVLIKFSSLVRVNSTNTGVVRLQYELFEACDGRQPLSLGTWMFEKDTQGQGFVESIQESFNFIFCGNQTMSRCCDYFVTVTPIEITGEDASATVSNGRMAAFAQDWWDDVNKRQKKDMKKPADRESNKLILACGQGSTGGQTLIAQFSSPQEPEDIAQVTVDTTCLKKPKVLIEFSSIIEMSNSVFTEIALQFELFKVCGNSEPVSCGIWTFEETVGTEVDITFVQVQNSFGFIYCECSHISDCCVYFVRVTPLQTDLGDDDGALATWEVCNVLMNGYAQGTEDYDFKSNERKIYEDKSNGAVCKPVHPKPKKSLLACGSGSGNTTFTSSSDDTPFQLAHVTVDTSCLCKPVVDIEFSSTVRFEALENIGSAAQLRYELVRVCADGTPVTIGLWILDKLPILNVASIETFSFNYCDCTTCPGCCDYFVTVMPITFTSEGTLPDINGTVTVGDGRIAALAQEG
ncbi:DUF4489 domain-containing protein [Vallitalea pronyensis]|uniref:DUF4489 domain-containing protein n=1 Tax=Vallitalea pronyensis TaxID=1348613 RepID=A0A8J8SHB0_9FIRM|nr:DUF4489 domain-containing protein [Vallitalea pronyensis]QUI23188.1 DUF4489 domain-containing protein [Vallitalea pronyensis]